MAKRTTEASQATRPCGRAAIFGAHDPPGVRDSGAGDTPDHGAVHGAQRPRQDRAMNARACRTRQAEAGKAGAFRLGDGHK